MRGGWYSELNKGDGGQGYMMRELTWSLRDGQVNEGLCDMSGDVGEPSR